MTAAYVAGRRTTFLTALLLTVIGAYAAGVGLFGARSFRPDDPVVARIQSAAAVLPAVPPEPALGFASAAGDLALQDAAQLLRDEHALLAAGSRSLLAIGAALLLLSAVQWRLWYRLRRREIAAQAV